MQKKITLILSPEKRTEKPKDAMAEHRLIHDGNMVTITWEEFAMAMANGQSFSHGVFATERNRENFAGTQLIVLDIDNKNVEQSLTVKGALERLKEHGLGCNLIYTSFSDSIPKGETDAEILMTATRYRIVFELPDSICELDELDSLLRDFLYPIFPEADKVSGVQFWYGGKNIAFSNFDYVLDLEVLNSVIAIQRTSHLGSEKRRNEKLKGLATNPSYLMKMNDEVDDVLKNADAFNIYKAVAEKKTTNIIRNYDWDWACSQFDLLDTFLNCKKKVYYKELHYLYLAMSKIEGGAKKWKEAVKSNPDINDQKLESIAYYLEQRMKKPDYQLFEGRISKYAPDDKAATRFDFLTNISKKLNGKIELVDEEDNYFIPEPNATSALNYFFREVKSEHGNGKYVFKCATGLGKTEEIIKCNNLAECVIAVPTHKLKDEISARLKAVDVEHHVLPDLPKLPESIKHEYDILSGIGAYDKAASLLLEVTAGENNSKYSMSTSELQRIQDELSAYFKAIEECQDTTFPVLTTHKKLLTTKFPNHSTYIIDEDILPSLFEVKSTTNKDLRMLINKVKDEMYDGSSKDLKKLTKFLNTLGKEYFEKVTDSGILKDGFSPDSLKKFVKIALKHGLPLEGSLIGLFTSDWFYVNDKDKKNDPGGDKEIYYLKKSNLPSDVKIIVLSATADEEFYKQVLGDLDWHELSQVEQVGKLVQVHDNSFSRAWMKKKENLETIEAVRNLVAEKPVITFKRQRSKFANPAKFCLESSEGFDELIGQDIAVVGTPHLQIGVYALLATALGIPFSSDDLKLEMVKCEHQNQRFDFYTFKHEGLRKVQFYKIESQLTQACGRARAIRENVTVHLFSNFPLAGFEKITLAEMKRRTNPELMTCNMAQTFSSGSRAA